MVAFSPSSSLQRLLDASLRPGRLTWIGLRTARRGPVQVVDKAYISPEHGLLGDRYSGRSGGKRQATLIAREDLDAVAAFLGRDEPSLPPELVRRNLVIEGLNLQALKGRHLLIGSDADSAAILEVTGECHPCSRMEEVLGTGGYNALRSRGGLTARVLRTGSIHIGDRVEARLGGESPATLTPDPP